MSLSSRSRHRFDRLRQDECLTSPSHADERKDTSPEMQENFEPMLMKSSGIERMKMGMSIFDTARASGEVIAGT